MFRINWLGRVVCAAVLASVVSIANADYLSVDFFPLEAGLEWTYHWAGNCDEGLPFDVVMTAMVEEEQVSFGAQDAWELTLWTDGEKDDSIFYFLEGGAIYIPQKPYRSYTPSLLYLPALLTVGQTTTDTVDTSWTFDDGTVLAGPTQRSITPIGLESVTVLAGTYTALRVDWEETTTGYWTDGVEWKEINSHTGSLWFVQGLGMIKRTVVGSETNYWRGSGDWVQDQQDFQDHTMQLVPEPATLSLLVLGGLALIRRRYSA